MVPLTLFLKMSACPPLTLFLPEFRGSLPASYHVPA